MLKIMITSLAIIAVAINLHARTNEPAKDTGAVYFSPDQGKNWQRADAGLPDGAVVNAFANNGSTVVAGTESHGIFISTNQAKNWYSINTGLPAKVKINTVTIYKNILFIGTFEHGIFASLDYGKMWFPSNKGLKERPIQCFQAVGDDLLVGTDVGVYISSDYGKSWVQTFEKHQINGFTTIGDNIYAALNKGIILSTDGGKNWKYIFDKAPIYNVATDGTRLYAMTFNKGVFKMDETGKSWLKWDTGLEQGRFTYQIKKVGNRLFAGQGNGLYKSDTQGLSWELMASGLPQMAYPTLLVTHFGVIVSTVVNRLDGC